MDRGRQVLGRVRPGCFCPPEARFSWGSGTIGARLRRNRGASEMTPAAAAEPTYLGRIVQLLLEDAVRAGENRDQLLDGLHLDPKRLVDPDARLPLTTFAAIVRAVVANARTPAFGLRAGSGRKTRD